MAEYLIQEETLTNLGDQIRVLNGTEESMTPAVMNSKLGEANDEVDAQSELIDQLSEILEGKATGGGSENLDTEISEQAAKIDQLLTILDGKAGGGDGVEMSVVDAIIDGSITELKSNALVVGEHRFWGCNALTKADFPAATSIGAMAFYNCSAFDTLILRSKTVCTLKATSAFTGTAINKTGYIYVPRTLADGTDGPVEYSAATNWSSFDIRFRAIEDYPEITGG